MRIAVISALLMAIGGQASAQAPRVVEVRLSNFDFTPRAINLPANQPVVLHLVNTSGGGHNFSAPQLFAAARGVSGPVRNGTVEVRSHQAVDVRLTPTAGTYRLRCTHTFHTTFGMRGQILVR